MMMVVTIPVCKDCVQNRLNDLVNVVCPKRKSQKIRMRMLLVKRG